MSTLSAALRDLRTAAGLTQVQLADRVPLSLRSLQDYEQGRKTPNAKAFLGLCRALGVESPAFRHVDLRL